MQNLIPSFNHLMYDIEIIKTVILESSDDLYVTPKANCEKEYHYCRGVVLGLEKDFTGTKTVKLIEVVIGCCDIELCSGDTIRPLCGDWANEELIVERVEKDIGSAITIFARNT